MNRRLVRRIVWAVSFLGLGWTLWAEDIVTTSGTVLNNARIIALDAEGVTIQYHGRTEKFALSAIPDAAVERYRYQALRHKAAEVEKLNEELARQEKELKQLKADNEKLRREQKRPAAYEIAPVPLTLLAEMPPVKTGDVIGVADLVRYYAADPEAAERHFGSKEFRIRGTVAEFGPKLFIRWYDVGLESPDKSVKVICKFGYRDGWQSVYTTARGRKLIAKVPRAEITLLKTGQPVIIQCRCEGLNGGDLEFNRCELVR